MITTVHGRDHLEPSGMDKISWGSSHLAKARSFREQANLDIYSIFITSILSTCINKTVLLVLCFWFPAPVWCFVFPALLFLVALFFGFVHGLGIVFRGRIDCVEDLE